MADSSMMEASKRDGSGKGVARKARRAGRVPGIVYGAGQEPMKIDVEARALRHRLERGGLFTHVIDLQIDGAGQKVLTRDVQLDPVTDVPLHIDFLRVSARTRVTVDVPVHFLNEDKCPGLRRGGVLNVVRHTVELSCIADRIPEAIEADLSGLDIQDSLHISAISLPDGVTPTITDRDFTVATIAAPTVAPAASEDEDEEGDAEGDAED